MQKKFLKKDKESSYKSDMDFYFGLLEKEYPKSVKDAVYFRICGILDTLIGLAEQCDSPIEFLLGEEITASLDSFNETAKAYYYLHPQPKIRISDKTYRVDFLLAPVTLEYDTRFPNLIIECDGHDFHEKTKEQAKRDKQRDRDLQSAGYRILRFTGSEIVKSPRNCAREVIHFLKQLDLQREY